jgi:hypothetical protein
VQLDACRGANSANHVDPVGKATRVRSDQSRSSEELLGPARLLPARETSA